MPSHDLLSITKQYLKALEEGATGERLAAFFTTDVVQEEFPNRLVPHGQRRHLSTPVKGLPEGGMSARFGVFLELREGKIARQRNYDCFVPW